MSKKRFAAMLPLPLLMGVAIALAPAVAQAAPHYYENGSKLPEEAEESVTYGKSGHEVTRTEEGTKAHPVIAWGPITLDSPAAQEIKCINQFYAYIWNPVGGGAGRSKTVGWAASECQDAFLETALATKHVYIAALPEFPEKAATTGVAPVDQRRGISLPWKSELCGKVENQLTFEGVWVNRTGLEKYGEPGEGIEGANCEKEATPVHTKCYPAGKKWEEIVENPTPAAGEIARGFGCIILDFVIPEALAEEASVFFGTNEAESVEGIANGLSPAGLTFYKEAAEGISSGALESQNEGQGHGTTLGAIKTLGANGQQLIDVKEP